MDLIKLAESMERQAKVLWLLNIPAGRVDLMLAVNAAAVLAADVRHGAFFSELNRRLSWLCLASARRGLRVSVDLCELAKG